MTRSIVGVNFIEHMYRNAYHTTTTKRIKDYVTWLGILFDHRKSGFRWDLCVVCMRYIDL